MATPFLRSLQWLGVAAVLFAVVGLTYDFNSEAGKTMNVSLPEEEIPDFTSTISYLGYAEVSDSDGNQSQSITVPANTDFALAFIGGWRSGTNPAVTSISLGGTAMTSVGSSVSDAEGAAYMYYVNTSSGSKTFASVQSNSWTEGGKAVLLFFSGVHQSSPIRSSSALNAADNATLSFSGMTSLFGDMAVLQMQGYSSTNVDVDLSSQTKIFENGSAFNSEYNAAAYKNVTGATANTSCYGNYPGAVVAVLKPAVAAPEVSANLPIGYWTFDGNDIVWSDTGSEIKDVGSNGNHGAVSGLTRTSVTPGKLGQGLSFNGTSDYINAPLYLTAVATTVSLWLKLDDLASYYYPIGSNLDAGDKFWEILIKTTGDIDIIYVNSGGSYVERQTSSAPISSGRWHHIVIVFDVVGGNGTVGLYVNGIAVSLDSSTVTGWTKFGSPPLTIGMTRAGYFYGKVDDVRIYNRVLSVAEVADLYAVGK